MLDEKDAPAKSIFVDLDDEEALKIAIEREFGPDEKEEVDPVFEYIRDHIHFRMFGYDFERQPLPWEKEAALIMALEKPLVVDPYQVKNEFVQLRNLRNNGYSDEQIHQYVQLYTQFGREGGHSHLNIAETLYRVRREGWIMIACITSEDGKRFLPVGYNYGLDQMPYDDNDFRLLAKSTMPRTAPQDEMMPETTVVNWRTGIIKSVDSQLIKELLPDIGDIEGDSVSVRRIGVGSALKYLITKNGMENDMDQITFNIGTIKDVDSRVSMRNVPSYNHSTKYYEEDMGYRPFDTFIEIREDFGRVEKVGRVCWRARGDDLALAHERLCAQNSLLRKRKWNLYELDSDLEIMRDQLKREKARGDHK